MSARFRYTETPERVGVPPDLVTRFRWRAALRCRKLERERVAFSYRWEVVHDDGRWAVAAFQNIAVPE